jgi:putative DNA primase/helicase
MTIETALVNQTVQGVDLFDHLIDPGSSFDVPCLYGTDARDGTETTRPLSELGNAMRLNDAHTRNLHYVSDG